MELAKCRSCALLPGRLSLKDDQGGIVSVMVEAGFNVKSMPPAEAGKAPVSKVISEFIVAKQMDDPKGPFFRSCKPGVYDVYISVGQLDGTPVLELPYHNDDGKKRYKIGTITLTE